jgi:GDP-L-fucose synthase
MPTNLYGINDNFDLNSSHVLPALIRKFHEAKINNSQSVTIWGTGNPKREFLYVDDLAQACIHLMLNYSDENHINVGTGEDISIKELSTLVKTIVGYHGEIINDLSKPDGTPKKLLDVGKLTKTGWKATTTLEVGISMVYQWFLSSNVIKL